MRYTGMLVGWLNERMTGTDGQEIARLVNWYNGDRLEEDFPHPPHDVSERELLRRSSKHLKRGLRRLRVDMCIDPSWNEAQKLRSQGGKCISLKLLSGRYALGVEYKRDTWDGLGYVLSLLQSEELWRIRQCGVPGCRRWFVAKDHLQHSCSPQCRQKKYAQTEKGKKSNVIRQGRYQRRNYRSYRQPLQIQ